MPSTRRSRTRHTRRRGSPRRTTRTTRPVPASVQGTETIVRYCGHTTTHRIPAGLAGFHRAQLAASPCRECGERRCAEMAAAQGVVVFG